jgi:hypothetical protein
VPPPSSNLLLFDRMTLRAFQTGMQEILLPELMAIQPRRGPLTHLRRPKSRISLTPLHPMWHVFVPAPDVLLTVILQLTCLDALDDFFSDVNLLLLDFDHVGDPTTPARMHTSNFDNVGTYRRHSACCWPPAQSRRPPSTSSLDSSPSSTPSPQESPATDSSLLFREPSNMSLARPKEPEGYLSCSGVRTRGSTSTLLELHGTSVVAKCFGPAEGSPDRDRDRDQWRKDFETERRIYETALRPLWGSVVPTYYGAFVREDVSPASEGKGFILLEDAGRPISRHENFEDLFITKRCAPLASLLCIFECRRRQMIRNHLLQLTAVGVYTWWRPATSSSRLTAALQSSTSVKSWSHHHPRRGRSGWSMWPKNWTCPWIPRPK